MKKIDINLIVAVGEAQNDPDKKGVKNFPIGKDGKMPWHNSTDLKWFRKTTEGNIVIMGYKTFLSIGKRLPNRINIVITNRDCERRDDVLYAENLDTAISLAEKISLADNFDIPEISSPKITENVSPNPQIFIIGGGKIYNEALEKDIVDYVYMDHLKEKINDADTFFPNLSIVTGKWKPFKIGMITHDTCPIIYRRTNTQSNIDMQYLNLADNIIEYGEKRNTRAGLTRSLFAPQLRFNLKKGLPLLTTKKVFYKGCIIELLWFLKGGTNIKYLVENNVHIWDDDAYRFFIEKSGNKELSKDKFIYGVLNEFIYKGNDGLDYKYGDLGPVYGKQWTDWNGTNQIDRLIETLKKNPDDRRLILSSWNVGDLNDMALPPCHYSAQFYTEKLSLDERKRLLFEKTGRTFGKDELNDSVFNKYSIPERRLSCLWNQRSVDVLLGLPFNMLSYAVLTHMIAQCVNMEVGELVFNGGDTHIYENQIPTYLNVQKRRNPVRYSPPTLKLNPEIKTIYDFKPKDIEIIGYESYDVVKYPLSVGL